MRVKRASAPFEGARVLLDVERDNVTTIDAIPLPSPESRLVARRCSSSIWRSPRGTAGSLVRLHADARTAPIPVIVTTPDERLLAHAER